MTFHDRKPPRIVALGGPVTAAIRAVRDDLSDAERERVRTLRKAIADRIEADIALLDALAPDADLEDEGDREEENEHGGDIQDEPHDPEPDAEPSLCGITVDERFWKGGAGVSGEDEPSLASLGGTARGIDQPQTGWAKGGRRDCEVDTGCVPHTRPRLWQEPGPALADAKAFTRKRRQQNDALRIVAGPWGGAFSVSPVGRR